MENSEALEKFYTYLDQVANRLYEMDETPYLKGIVHGLDYLLDDEVRKGLVDVVYEDLKRYKDTIREVAFDKETVRKAVQLALLNGFKTMGVTNSMMTPDSIGMFIAYLLKKLYKDDAALNIYDPLIGTGNLAATINNHFSGYCHFEGSEADPLLSELSRNFLDALEIDHQIYHQDTLTFDKGDYDLVLTDFPVESIDRKMMYFPYQVILKHMHHVKVGGFFIAVIENDFFDQKEASEFKEKLMKTMHLYGLIKFDEGLFKNHPQSLLIMQKKAKEDDQLSDFLLADLPPFTEEKRFNEALSKIEQWFSKQKG